MRTLKSDKLSRVTRRNKKEKKVMS